jgi:hypothetical protein
MRLRIIDIATPWFWFVCFYRRESSGHIVAHLYDGPNWCKGWFHIWKWEKLPDELGGFAIIPPDPMTDKASLECAR